MQARFPRGKPTLLDFSDYRKARNPKEKPFRSPGCAARCSRNNSHRAQPWPSSSWRWLPKCKHRSSPVLRLQKRPGSPRHRWHNPALDARWPRIRPFHPARGPWKNRFPARYRNSYRGWCRACWKTQHPPHKRAAQRVHAARPIPSSPRCRSRRSQDTHLRG